MIYLTKANSILLADFFSKKQSASRSILHFLSCTRIKPDQILSASQYYSHKYTFVCQNNSYHDQQTFKDKSGDAVRHKNTHICFFLHIHGVQEE